MSDTDIFRKMSIEYIKTSLLCKYYKPLRKHTSSKIERLANFMQHSGIIVPLVIDENNNVVLGNARLDALKYLNVEQIPVIRVTHLNDAMIRSLILADNQFTINAEWYKDALKEELNFLLPLVIDNGLELTDLGFETPQIDLIIGEPDYIAEDKVDYSEAPVTKIGDIWLLGNHKIICGDARDEFVYDALLGKERANMVFADLPYNVPINGHVCGNGSLQHKEFIMGVGEMSPKQFISFMHEIFILLKGFSTDGSIHMQCMDWRHSLEILTAAERSGYEYLNLACWVKHSGGMGSFYRSQHELVHIFKSGDAKHVNNIMLGKYGRNRTNVWQYDGANSLNIERKKDRELHSTVKPVDMVIDAIKDCTNRNDIVLDPTGGSGTTLIAAERSGRIARIIELDPYYCDITLHRWQQCTGKRAVSVLTGEEFDA